jgi:hypothetical protein
MLSARDAPPAYAWDLMEWLAFVAGALFFALLIEGCLLIMPGFSDLLLLIGGGFAIRYVYKAVPRFYVEWMMRRELRKELDQHGQD